MAKIDATERETQNAVVALFRDPDVLGYEYYGDLRGQDNPNVRADDLAAWLTSPRGGGHSPAAADLAIDELRRTAANLSQGLYEANKATYDLLRYGAKVRERGQDCPKTVNFIDWERPGRNGFALAEEVTIKNGGERRPDLVVYINGIALAVIELKKATVSVADGIRQNISNQNEHFNAPFFTTIQYLMAGNTSEGLRYGAIGTPEKYYLQWKNEPTDTTAEPLDDVSRDIAKKCRGLGGDKLGTQLFSMFEKRRFLDLMHNFIAFDGGVKKICRHNQFFGVKKAQVKLKRGQGGIIWHTQGSGKSLTMVWLSRWILSHSPGARVLIVTDRDELDKQIEKVYKGVDVGVRRTYSGRDLRDALESASDRLVCTLVHKFGARGGGHGAGDGAPRLVADYLADLKKSLPSGFKAKGDFTVFVDECHRSHSGLLHAAMKEFLPQAVFIGFTGTPILSQEKKSTLAVFEPGFIHTYKYDEAVADGVVLDLCYEARDVDQAIAQPRRVDEFFARKTRGLNDNARAKIKAKWANMPNVLSASSRLDVIVRDIMDDFAIKPRLASGQGTALLVAADILSACRYYQKFQARGFKGCAMVTSYSPNDATLSVAPDDSEGEKRLAYEAMLRGQSPEAFEEEAKRQFVKEPGKMRLLIVVDKLLTGFDAPTCTYLYIDKNMQNHGLFQAICRVNRLDGESKELGYIIDYKRLLDPLAKAMGQYTSALGAFGGYDADDVKGMVKNSLQAGRERFNETLQALDDLCDPVPGPRGDAQFIHFFCGADGLDGLDDAALARSRETLYRLVNRLARAYAMVANDPGEPGDMAKKVAHYVNVKNTVGRASGDFIDFKAYGRDMRQLFDTYFQAEDSRKIGGGEGFTLLDFARAQSQNLAGPKQEAAAEAIENNIRKKIVERLTVNPKYYQELSEILTKLTQERRAGALAYQSLVKAYIDLINRLDGQGDKTRYPDSIRQNEAKRALFDNCGRDERLALSLYAAAQGSVQHGFRYDEDKARLIKAALYNVFSCERGLGEKEAQAQVEHVYKIVEAQEDRSFGDA